MRWCVLFLLLLLPRLQSNAQTKVSVGDVKKHIGEHVTIFGEDYYEEIKYANKNYCYLLVFLRDTIHHSKKMIVFFKIKLHTQDTLLIHAPNKPRRPVQPHMMSVDGKLVLYKGIPAIFTRADQHPIDGPMDGGEYKMSHRQKK